MACMTDRASIQSGRTGTPGEASPGSAQVITRTGRLSDRDAWTAEGHCSVERALELIGTRSAMILVREAFLGSRRFDELTRRTGLSEGVAAQRLRQLVNHGLLTQQPYQEPGDRTRHEYVLTERGRSLFHILVALMRWGDELGKDPAGIELVHAGCGAPIAPVEKCAVGHDVTLSQTEARLAAPH